MKKDKILSNKYIENIRKINIEVINKNPLTSEDIKRWKKGTEAKKIKMSSFERYSVDIFYRLMEILETLDDLKATLVFLRQYPYPKTLTKHKITKSFYLTYHIEFYLVKLASLRDKLALLVNEVFILGLPDKHVKVDLISKMKQIKGKHIVKLLKNFNDSLEGVASSKNIIVHKGKYDDKALAKLSMYELVNTGRKKIVPPGLLKIMASLYIQEKIRIFRKNQKSIEKFLDLFFLELNKEFNKRYKSSKKP